MEPVALVGLVQVLQNTGQTSVIRRRSLLTTTVPLSWWQSAAALGANPAHTPGSAFPLHVMTPGMAVVKPAPVREADVAIVVAVVVVVVPVRVVVVVVVTVVVVGCGVDVVIGADDVALPRHRPCRAQCTCSSGALANVDLSFRTAL